MDDRGRQGGGTRSPEVDLTQDSGRRVDGTISVIIASYNSRATIGGCLESLRRQRPGTVLETIVVDSSTDGTALHIQQGFPEVKVHRSDTRLYAGAARNVGIAHSRGDIVALIDADCIADDRWSERILAAHQSPALVVGGSIGNGNPSSYVGWAAYLCEFSHWMPSAEPGYIIDAAGANVSYKREAFVKYSSFIEGTYCSDTEFHWRLANGGHEVYFDPAILVYHRNIEDAGRFLRHEFHHGRCFGRVRQTSLRFSTIRRVLYASLFPLIAAKLLVRVLWICWRLALIGERQRQSCHYSHVESCPGHSAKL